MEIEVLEQSDKKIMFTLEGSGHTFCNHLKSELYNDKDIDVAAYKVDHPLTGTPVFILEAKKKVNFQTILADAVKRVKATNKEFLAAVKKL
ncbi:MAG: RpoL/Rpb11 RNA polymerase subunit family protein [Candidatus Woesearchaeota archaeon]